MNRPTEQTFVTARAQFEDVFGNVAKAKRNWQVMAFGLLLLLVIITGAYVRLSATSRITPYVVEVDKLGRAIAFGPAEPLKSTDRRIVIAQLATFLTNVRTVVPSAAAQRDVLRRAYAFADERGAAFLNEYFSAPLNDPRLLSRTMTRLIEITGILAVPSPPGMEVSAAIPATWKVRWTETEIPIDAGSIGRTTAWEGYLTVRQIPPKRADIIEENPLGLYVTAIAWTQIASRTAVPAPVPPLSPGDVVP